ncbi:UNC93-like protein MFSD11 [Liparis tanakae]|uniref:UNC93-like protein MFSD11 n=1 Tax=Liparis tanakae TaxID=230148 RepID=A0A4Z2E2K7_9TELE|nr:UNC93-like protein MFSD11 [Liparis tanakae]
MDFAPVSRGYRRETMLPEMKRLDERFLFLSVLWTAQGHFLVENSDASTINRNTGMFWALLQCRYAAADAVTHALLPPRRT